jgi:hypothetical protein
MKKIFTNSIFLALLSVAGITANAQQRPVVFGRPVKTMNPDNGMIRCVSSEYEDYQREQGMKEATHAEFETWIAQKIKERKAQKSPNSVTEVITIPVVVHVIHNGDAEGNNENIDTEQVLSQIEVLNQDFRRMAGTPGWNDEEVGADVEIEFCLAHTSPTGEYTTGIDRVNMGQASWTSMASIENTLKPQTIWDPYSYFNIWVCNFGGNMSDILGYAQFPNTTAIPGNGNNNGGDDTDGVVIGYRYFGSSQIYPQGTYQFPYNRGRTATHEIGHCLGLIHIWGDGGSQAFNVLNCNATDYCADTPFAGWDNYDCTQDYDSCPAKPGLDMTNNYMDYTNDSCMDVFTQDQKERMLTVMDNAPRRESLKTSTVCQDPTAGIEDMNGLKGLYLYPNPAQNMVTISGLESNLPDSFTIFNSLGQTIATVKVNGTADLTVNTSAYANGVYLVKVDSGSQSKTFKFVKN